MDPFVTRLQEMSYREGSLQVGAAAEGIEVSRFTLSGWTNERWPIPLYGAQRLVCFTADKQLARAFVHGTGLRVVAIPSQPSPQPLFYLLGQHMSVYSRLLELLDKAKKHTITTAEREEGERICEEFRILNDQVEAEFKRPEDKE